MTLTQDKWKKFGALSALWLVTTLSSSAGWLELGPARLALEPDAQAWIEFSGGKAWPKSNQPVIAVQSRGVTYPATKLQLSEKSLVAEFSGSGRAEFEITKGEGFALFRLSKLDLSSPADRLTIFTLATPLEAEVSGTLNSASFEGNRLAIMAATPNVHATSQNNRTSQADRDGCKHDLTRISPGKVGNYAGQFTASCDAKPGGWSMSGRYLGTPLDLTGCQAIRAWVHGDGKGQSLKIQLHDNAGGYRDDYIPINFTGWQQMTLTKPALNTLHYDRIMGVSLYYNGLPADTTVTCLVDQIEAVIEREGKSITIPLEDFEDPSSPMFSFPVRHLSAETVKEHGIEPATFGVIACKEDQFPQVLQRFEEAAGLPSPKLDGVWNKLSPRIKRSYLFLTNFRESQVEQGLALAKRGGFDTVLFGQESWAKGTGHYNINTDRYPDGLEGLKRTLDQFKAAGFHVGLHFLAPSIYSPDSYLTPVPDPRLVKGATATLAADVSATDVFLPLKEFPTEFPDEDGGYTGAGTILQIGDELIKYTSKSQSPVGFAECKRGHVGTKAVAHPAGTVIRHLVRAYGYHMYDLDTTLADEVAANFAHVANTCGIQMVYFDGSERLQGEHWYYNARLHKAFYDHLADKNTLLQGSSYSHYSWHALARSASADGHGDLKGYLDQRSGGFDWMEKNLMPLDIGWYYGYDPTCTPDMFEYVLGATLGYDSSMSFQVSVDAAAAHPFTGEILDLIARYEKLRLSGKLPEAIRKQLRIDPEMRKITPGDSEPELLAKRREYRLLTANGKEYLQKVIYAVWRDQVKSGSSWKVSIPSAGARVGVQLHVPKGAKVVDPVIRLGDQTWTWLGEVTEGQFVLFWPGEASRLYGPGIPEPKSGEAVPDLNLSGEHEAQFSAKEATGEPVRVRFTFQPAERLDF